MNFMVRSPVLQAWCQNAPFVLPPLGRDRIPFKLSINLRPPSMPSQPPPELRVRPPRRGAACGAWAPGWRRAPCGARRAARWASSPRATPSGAGDRKEWGLGTRIRRGFGIRSRFL